LTRDIFDIYIGLGQSLVCQFY